MTQWTPFRPTSQDLDRIDRQVQASTEIQAKLRANCPDLKVRDRVAHQYQIAGSKVLLQIAAQVPDNLAHVGLFEPNAEHIGIGRISTGLGCPHLETDPDFLGLMLAFRTKQDHRVDFLGINHPASPTDTHVEFMKLLEATADGAGAGSPFGSGHGELDLLDLLRSNLEVVRSLIGSLGAKRGGGGAAHVLAQTLRTAQSTTAYQTYWTGIVETGRVPGKFVIEPVSDENRARPLTPGERHLTNEWRERQARGSVEFDLHWIPFMDEQATPLVALTEPWQERRHLVGQVIFPRCDATSEEAGLWAALAAEMGANPGNWVRDLENSIRYPGTEFAVARQLVYRKSQAGRGALPEDTYARCFQTGEIDSLLAGELNRRRAEKRALGHVDTAP
jgi:hypothetical protein